MLLFILGTLTLLIFLAWATYRSALVLREIATQVNVLLMPAENVMRLGLLGVCFLLARASGLPDAQFGWNTTNLVQHIWLGVMVGAIVAISVPLLTRWAIAQFGKRIYSPIVVQSIMPRRPIEWLWIPLALIPAVALEEILFRSLLLGGFASFAPPFLLAVVWSLIFGAMHAPQGTLGIVVASALGLLLSAMFLSTQNIFAPIVAHYTINLGQLVWASRDRYWEHYDAGDHS
jgi:membrane protease YdiL (CAAX protease family)